MRVAAIQMVSGTSVTANLERAHVLLRQAADGGAELAVLPEYFCLLGQRDTDKLAIQERFGAGPIQDFLRQTARGLGLWIAGGTLPLSLAADAAPSDRSRVFNSLLVYSPQGECAARYDKMHLFRYDNGSERYDESRVLQRGQSPMVVPLDSRDGHRWNIGLSVCYDLRFAELYRGYSARGVDLLLVPSAFTYTTGSAHWELLLRARAVENLSYVVAPAQGGQHENGRRTWGHSMLVGPWGEVLAVRPQGEGVDVVELDASVVLQARRQLPALEHRVL